MRADRNRYDENEVRRLATLADFQILDTPATSEFDRITQLAKDLFQVSISQISLIDGERQWLKSCAGAPRSEVPRELAFCNVTLTAKEPVIVPDASLDPRFSSNPFVTGEPHIRLYAGVPLVVEGACIGTLCIVDSQPRTLSASDLATLKSLASLVCDQLWLHRKSIELETRTQDLAEAQRIAKLGFWRWAPGSSRFWWSEELYRLLSRDPETFEVTLESTFAHVHPEDREQTRAKLVATVTTGMDQSHEYRAVLADGRVLYFWSSTRPVLDAAGRIVEVRGICQDITARVEAEAALRESEENYRYAVELSAQVPWIVDAKGKMVQVSPRWSELTGIPMPSLLREGWWSAVHPEDLVALTTIRHASLNSGNRWSMEFRVQLSNGSLRWMRGAASPLLGPDGQVARWYGAAEDIHDRKMAELALKQSETRSRDMADQLGTVLESTLNCVFVVDRNWHVTYMNKRAREAVVLGPSLMGKDLRETLDEPEVLTRYAEAMAQQSSIEFESYFQSRGKWLQVQAVGRPDCLIVFFRDVTEEHQTREQLNHQAHHDFLTGLPNRALFLQRLEEALAAAAQDAGSVGMIYLDLDDFKEVNDTLGHDAGDVVLVEASRRLEQCMPSGALLARLGGDEFGILLPGSSVQQAEQLASTVHKALSMPVPYKDVELSTKASLGIAFYPESDDRPSELIKNADLALYKAKRLGGNQHIVFSPEVRQLVQQKVSALTCAREALMRDAIIPFYQPKVSLKTGKIYGFEALLRWVHPDYGIQAPGLIKEAFDDPALSLEIGRRMLQNIVTDASKWRAQGIPFGSIAINVAAQQFSRSDLAGEILQALNEAGLPPRVLEVEVTETVFLGDGSGEVGAALARLHAYGVSVSLDDFGTGYASLTHLTKFPVSWLKIDQSFVKEMVSRPDDAAIIRGVIALAHSLGIQVVAEGVETQAQWDRLRDKGCDLAQGYLVAKPMSSAHVPSFMRNWVDANKVSPDSTLTA